MAFGPSTTACTVRPCINARLEVGPGEAIAAELEEQAGAQDVEVGGWRSTRLESLTDDIELLAPAFAEVRVAVEGVGKLGDLPGRPPRRAAASGQVRAKRRASFVASWFLTGIAAPPAMVDVRVRASLIRLARARPRRLQGRGAPRSVGR